MTCLQEGVTEEDPEHESLSPLGKMIPGIQGQISGQVEQSLLQHNAPFSFPCLSELVEVIWLSASLRFTGLCVAFREGLTVSSLHHAAVLRDPSHRCVGSDDNRVRFAWGIVPFNSADLTFGLTFVMASCIHHAHPVFLPFTLHCHPRKQNPKVSFPV